MNFWKTTRSAAKSRTIHFNNIHLPLQAEVASEVSTHTATTQFQTIHSQANLGQTVKKPNLD